MPQNQFLPIATGTGANALTAAQWAALGTLLAQGFQSGVVPSIQFNTLLRQFSVPVSAIAQLIADNQSADVLDDGVVANFESKLKAAIQNISAYVAQAGQEVFFSAGGTGAAYTGTLVPAPTSLTPDMQVMGFFGTANTSTTPTLNLNGLGAKPILKDGGSAPAAGDISGFQTLILNSSGTSWVIPELTSSDVLALVSSKVPTRLTGNTTLYVNAGTGVDTNPGTSSAPFKTINAALTYSRLNIDLNGYNLFIQCQDSSTPYSSVMLPGPIANSLGTGALTIQGNNSTPTNTVIAGTSSVATVAVSGGGQLTLQGFTLSGSTGIQVVGSGTLVNISAINFGACTYAHMNVSGGSIGIIGSYTITGSANFHYIAYLAGSINTGIVVTITCSGTPGFTTFARATICGTISFQNVTFSGSATGQRYNADLNGVISTGGAGANYFPGNTAGSTATGGQYQ